VEEESSLRNMEGGGECTIKRWDGGAWNRNLAREWEGVE
jgi:hypothetical protein